MTQQIEVERTKIRTPLRDAGRAGASEREHNPHSAKRVITTFIVASAFAFAVIAGLVYMINSAAYQSTDDAFIDGHIVPVSAQVAGRVQSVYVDDNQSVSKGHLVVELDPRDFDVAARQKAAALASSQAQAIATQAAGQEAIAHVKTEQATVESDQATAAADAAQSDKAQSDLKRNEDLFKTKVVSPQDVDQFRATAKFARATLTAAEKKVLSDQALVSEAQAQVDTYVGLLQTANAQVRESDANLTSAKLTSPTRGCRPRNQAGSPKNRSKPERTSRLDKTCSRSCRSRSGSQPTSRKIRSARCDPANQSRLKWMRWEVRNFAGTSIAFRPAVELDSVCFRPKMQQAIT
jgi:Biotin-lipoyl like